MLLSSPVSSLGLYAHRDRPVRGLRFGSEEKQESTAGHTETGLLVPQETLTHHDDGYVPRDTPRPGENINTNTIREMVFFCICLGSPPQGGTPAARSMDEAPDS